MDIPEVTILPEWRKKAEEYAKAAGMPSMKTGKLAEYVVINYFRSKGVPVKEDQTHPTQPDFFDLNLGNTLVDVKSCLAPASELRVTKAQFDRGKRFHFYIGVQISRDREKARLFGFCTSKEIKSASTRKVGHRDCYILPFSKLRPIETLANSFSKEL